MKCTRRILSALMAVSMLLTMLPIIASAEEAVYETPILENFDSGLEPGVDIGGWTAEAGQNYQWAANAGTYNIVESNGIVGRVAEEGDKCMQWLYDGVSGSSNTLFFMPQRGSQAAIDANRAWGPEGDIPAGNVIDISFDFAADSSKWQAGGSGVLEFTLNAAGDHFAIETNIPYHGDGWPDVIQVRTQSQGQPATQLAPIDTFWGYHSIDTTVWHNLKYRIVYDETGETNTGKFMIYLDGEKLIAEPQTFTYTDTPSGLPGNLGSYHNGSPWTLMFRNTTWHVDNTTNPDDYSHQYRMYIDNVKMGLREDYGLADAIARAEEVLADSDTPVAIKTTLNSYLLSANEVKNDFAALDVDMEDWAKRLNDLCDTAVLGGEVYIPTITEDFNSDLVIDNWNGTTSQWAAGYGSYTTVESNGILGRTAQAGDKAMKCLYDGVNGTYNFLYYLPTRGTQNDIDTQRSWGPNITIPAGNIIDVSFDFALDTSNWIAGGSGQVEFTLNAAGDHYALQTVIPYHGAGYDEVLDISVKSQGDPGFTPAPARYFFSNSTWHNMKYRIVYDESSATKSAKVMVYLDGNALYETPLEFTYTDTPSTLIGNLGSYYNGAPWSFMVRNTTWHVGATTEQGNGQYQVYVDNLKMGLREDCGLSDAIARAEDAAASGTVASNIKALLEKALVSAKAINDSFTASDNEMLQCVDELNELCDLAESGQAFYVPTIVDDFNTSDGDFAYAPDHLTDAAWYPVVAGRGYIERSTFDNDAQAGDRMLMIPCSLPWMFHRPKTGSANAASLGQAWALSTNLNEVMAADMIPFAETVEYSFDLAVEVVGDKAQTVPEHGFGGGIEIAVNAVANANPIGISLDDNTGVIWGVDSLSPEKAREAVSVKKDLNPEGKTEIHRVTFLIQHNSGNKGKACVLVDGELMGKVFDFTYSSLKQDALPDPLGAAWDPSEFYSVMYRNYTDDRVYIDNVTTRVVNRKYNAIAGEGGLLEEALELYVTATLGDGIGEYTQSALDEFKAVIENAYSVANGAKTDITGNIDYDSPVMYGQDDVDKAIGELSTAIKQFPKNSNRQELTLVKSGSTLSATFKKKVFADTSINAKLILGIYSENDKLLKLIVDDGNGVMNFTNVSDEGLLKQLDVDFDASTVAGAKYAIAYVWDGLLNMEPLMNASNIITIN